MGQIRVKREQLKKWKRQEKELKRKQKARRQGEGRTEAERTPKNYRQKSRVFLESMLNHDNPF